LKKGKIGKIIFSKVLEMPLNKYLVFIEKTTNESQNTASTDDYAKKNYIMLR